MEYRNSEGRSDRNPELAAELVRLKVELIVVAAGAPGSPGGEERDQDPFPSF